MLTTVQTSVQLISRTLFLVVSPKSCSWAHPCLRRGCVQMHGTFIRSFTPPDYSGRMCGRGHAVPSVVLEKNKTPRAVSLMSTMTASSFAPEDVKDVTVTQKCLFYAESSTPKRYGYANGYPEGSRVWQPKESLSAATNAPLLSGEVPSPQRENDIVVGASLGRYEATSSRTMRAF